MFPRRWASCQPGHQRSANDMSRRLILIAVATSVLLTTGGVVALHRRPLGTPAASVVSAGGQRIPGLLYGLELNRTFAVRQSARPPRSSNCDPTLLGKALRLVETVVHAQGGDPCSIPQCGQCTGYYEAPGNPLPCGATNCTGGSISTTVSDPVNARYSDGYKPSCSSSCTGSGCGTSCSATQCSTGACQSAATCGGIGCVNGFCAPCTTAANCSGSSNGTACVNGSCVQCSGDGDCLSPDLPNHVCNPSTHTCVQCTSSETTWCPDTAKYCLNNACVSCTTDDPDQDECPGCTACDAGSHTCTPVNENCPEYDACGIGGTVCDSTGCCQLSSGGGDCGSCSCDEGNTGCTTDACGDSCGQVDCSGGCDSSDCATSCGGGGYGDPCDGCFAAGDYCAYNGARTSALPMPIQSSSMFPAVASP